MLNRLKPILGLQLNVLFDGALLVIDKLGDLLAHLLAALLCCLEPGLEVPLPIHHRLLLQPQHLLLTQSVPVQVSVDLAKLVVQQDVEALLRGVDNLIKTVLKVNYSGFILFDLVILALLD